MKCTGINAKTYRAAQNLIKGNSLKFGTDTRIFYIVCYNQLILIFMSIYSMANEHNAQNNAEKIAEMINNSDDINFKKELLPILENYAKNSNGLFGDKQLSQIIKSINDEDWSY